MKLKILFILFILFIISVSAEPYNIDENMQLNENDIYNISNANASNFYQGIYRVLDENSTLNVSNINVSNENVNSSLYSNRTKFWGTLEGVSNITGLLMSQISDIWSTVVESITSSDVYIILSGSTGNVTISLNETKLNETIIVIVTESNNSMKEYVDTQDVTFNESMKDYVIANNGSMKSYVDLNNATQASEISNNNDNITIISDRERTNNATQAAEISAKHTPGVCAAGEAVQNTTTGGVECIALTTDTKWPINTTVLSNQSGTLGIVGTFWSNIYATLADTFSRSVIVANFLNISDQRYNETSELDSQITQQQNDNTTQSGQISENTDLINAVNTTANIEKLGFVTGAHTTGSDVVNWVGNWSEDKSDYYTSSETDTAIENSNDSLKSYVDTRDIFYNSSIINHTNETFIAKASEEDLNVNSSDYWDDNANPSDIQDELLISCGNISGATSNLCTITPTAGSQWTINTTVLSNQSGILGIVGTYWSNIYATLADTFSRSVIIANFLNITDQRYNETSELDSQITQQLVDNATQAAVILANNNTQAGEISNLDSAILDFVNKSGDDMTGNLGMGGNAVLNASTNWEGSTEGLILEFPFDTSNYVNSSLTLDSSSQQNDGIVYGATFNSSGGFDNDGAYMFDGGNDYISIPDDASLHINNTFTITLWAKLDKESASGYQTLLSKDGADSGEAFALRRHMATDDIYFAPRCYDDSPTSATQSVTSMPLDTWTFIVVTINPDNNYYVLSINGGAFEDNDRLNCGLYPSTAPLLIGASESSSPTEFWNGSIDEVRIYDRSLSTIEIQNLYEQKVKSKDAYGYRAKDNTWYGIQIAPEFRGTSFTDGTIIITGGDITGADDINGTDLFVTTVTATGAIAGLTINTGQGANELYDMDQNVLKASDVTFNNITSTNLLGDTDPLNHQIYDNATCWIMKAGTTTFEVCE